MSDKNEILVRRERNQEEIDFLKSLIPELEFHTEFPNTNGDEFFAGQASVAQEVLDMINERLIQIGGLERVECNDI